jgi:CRISPR type I-D-associated protein Csc1
MRNYIGNYALMYAMNRHVQVIQRNAAGTAPFYNQDMSKISIYATPAHISSQTRVPLASHEIAWENRHQTYITFNSVNTITQLTETGRANLPQIGRKARYPPLNNFEFFAIGGNPAGVIRLGKKQVPCRIHVTPLVVERTLTDMFQPSHPVNITDLGDMTAKDIESGELIRQTPPLLVNARLRCQHYICSDGHNKKFLIARPDPERYQDVLLP